MRYEIGTYSFQKSDGAKGRKKYRVQSGTREGFSVEYEITMYLVWERSHLPLRYLAAM